MGRKGWQQTTAITNPGLGTQQEKGTYLLPCDRFPPAPKGTLSSWAPWTPFLLLGSFLRDLWFPEFWLLRRWRLPSPADATQITTAQQSTDPTELPARKCLWGGCPVSHPKTSPAQRRSGVLPAAGKLLLSPPHASRPSPSHATLADSLIPRPVRDLSLRTGRGRGDDDPDGPWRLLRLNSSSCGVSSTRCSGREGARGAGGVRRGSGERTEWRIEEGQGCGWGWAKRGE